MQPGEGLVATAVALLVGVAVILHGWSRHCPRCWWWFIGRTLSKQVDVGAATTTTVLRDGKWVKHTSQPTTTHRHLVCRNCGHEWWTKNGAVVGGSAPPLPPLPPLSPEARRRRRRLAGAGAAAAVVLVALATLVGHHVPGRLWYVLAGLVGLCLATGGAGAVAAVGPWRPYSRALVLLALLAAVVPLSVELVQRALALAWTGVLQARWAEARTATRADVLEGYLELEGDLLDDLPGGTWARLPRHWDLAVERRDYLRALASADVGACKRYLRGASDLRRVLKHWVPPEELAPELAGVAEREAEVRARLSHLRREAGERFRAARRGADPAAVELVASILDGTAPQYADATYSTAHLADGLALDLQAEVPPTLAPHELSTPAVESDWRAVSLAQLEALVEPAANMAVRSATGATRGFVLPPHPGGAVGVPRLDVTCTLAPGPILLDEANRSRPTLDVSVAAVCSSPAWSSPRWTFRVEADPAAATPERLWRSLFERAFVGAIERVLDTLGLAGG